MTRSFSIDSVLRIRREQPTRLEGFVDASFAFAVTFVVISVGHVPTSVPEMMHALRGLPAFALSFLLIARFWKVHRDWSRHYDIEDDTAVALSLVLVFIVLAFVYPLRFIFALLIAWLSDGQLTDQPIEIRTIDEYRMAFEVFGLGYAAIAVVFVRLYRHALHLAASVGLNAAEQLATQMHERLWQMLGGIAVVSSVSAAMLPFAPERHWLFMVPGMLYALIGAFAPAIRAHYRRRIAALPAQA